MRWSAAGQNKPYEIVTWLKARHAEAAEPGEHLPSSQGGVEIRRWKKADQQRELLQESLDRLEAEGFTPDRLLLLTPSRRKTVRRCRRSVRAILATANACSMSPP
ncbi:hypothetical protein [Halomonas sp.]|uniref:hypothetical protein n=1 Tax=Halomonas sp. TaxID=1486246 RepID=UPI00356456F1